MYGYAQSHISPSDVNWLLSTTAQTTAALVAFIGGFILYRAIDIKNEVTRLFNQEDDLIDQLQIAKEDVHEASKVLLESNKKWFFEHHKKAYATSKGNINTDELLGLYQPPDSNSEDISTTAVALKKIVSDYYQRMAQNDPLTEVIPGVTDGSEQEDFEFKEWVWKELDQYEKESTARTAIGLSAPEISIVNTKEGRELRQRRVADLNAAYRRKQDIELALGAIDFQLYVPETLADLAVGLRVLFGFGTVGILLPLWMMTRRPVAPGPEARNLVFYGFLVGVLALSAFIWRLVRSSRRILRFATYERTSVIRDFDQ